MTGADTLESEIRRLIMIAGPMPVSEFMGHCLGHPKFGYYVTHDPIGAGGDFTTSPEISQMFGELLGLWSAAVWRQMGAPANVRLIELGPGRGTMMHDMLRAAHVMPDFRRALAVDLVETSPVLRARQQQTLGKVDVAVAWHDALADVPEGPAIIVANEFFDALPVNQAVRQADGWHDRIVNIDDHGNLAFALAGETLKFFEQTLPPQVRMAEVGAIYEWRGDGLPLEIGRRVVHGGGGALIIDYGHAESMIGDTFQALRSQRRADPLLSPGLADLTAHVDFQALGSSAESIGARVHGPVDQATFLRRLGIEQRAANLKKVAPPEKAAAVDLALARLTAGGASGMGHMFKALGISTPEIAALPGFEV
ncbi:MAG TPA: SAM-dependent methyltransferase [Xanthobacteraceae bacterium]|nr:SAM-dependent methyltransferase [Xanthobacteraceae bacterium]